MKKKKISIVQNLFCPSIKVLQLYLRCVPHQQDGISFFIIWKATAFCHQARAVHQTGINLKMHMHEIIEAFMAKRRLPANVMWVTKDTAWFSLHLLHSNLFLDRLDEIKWRAVRDGCQEETGSFFWLHFGGYQGFWSGWEHAYHTPRVNSPHTATKPVFVMWLTVIQHAYSSCWEYKCLNGEKDFPFDSKQYYTKSKLKKKCIRPIYGLKW